MTGNRVLVLGAGRKTRQGSPRDPQDDAGRSWRIESRFASSPVEAGDFGTFLRPCVPASSLTDKKISR